MLVNFLSGKKTQVEHLAGVQHRIRKRRRLLPRHPTQHYRHQPRRDLVIRNLSASATIYQKFNLRTRQRTPIPLPADEIGHTKCWRRGTRQVHARRVPPKKIHLVWSRRNSKPSKQKYEKMEIARIRPFDKICCATSPSARAP